MKLSHVSFVLRRVVRSLRELFLSHILTCGTMATTLFVFGGFLLFQQNVYGLLRGWRTQVQVFAYLKDDLKTEDLSSLLNQIRAFPEVESVKHVSKEDAWKDFKTSLGAQASILEGLSADILPQSLEVNLKRDAQDGRSLKRLVERLRENKTVSEVEYPEEWLEKMSLLLLGVQWAQWIFGGFLFLATVLIVGNTAKLAILARKDEIQIMQLIGASRGLIKAPFILEGMIQGLFGAGLSVLFLWLLFLLLQFQLPDSFWVFIPREQLRFLSPFAVEVLLLLGWLMGAGGSLLSLTRFLKI